MRLFFLASILVLGLADRAAAQTALELFPQDAAGPGSAYEKWRKTPAYQEWRKDTGQVK